MAKKTFPCGHKGNGQFCHTCKQLEEDKNEQVQAKTEKQQWKEAFSRDPIDLRGLPRKKLVLKARAILEAIRHGEPFPQLNGKRMNYNRKIISVPIDNDYRILFKEDKDGLIPFDLLSHEDYNVKKPGASKV
jgi:hypothetical protein